MPKLTLRPSAAGTWVKCPGSVKMQAEAPSYGDPHTGDEGTAAHWAAAEILAGKTPQENWMAPNGVLVTEEMRLNLQDYVAAVLATKGRLHIEESVQVDHVHPQLKGTPDCWSYDGDKRMLTIDDLKFGWTIVEPYENWQMICYALGAMALIVTDLTLPVDMGVQIRIIQPRPYHRNGSVRSWTLTAAELERYASRLRAAAVEALSDSPTVTAGEHCKYCTARYSCPSADRAALMAIDLTESAVLDRLPDERLGLALETLYRAAEAIKFRLTGLEQQAISTIQQGGHIEGWTTEGGRGKKTWSKSDTEVFALGDLLGLELRAAAKPITPVQAKKAGLSADMLSVYSALQPGKVKLMPVSDTLANKAFGGG